MDKSKVVSILAPYSPPLSLSQVDAIASEIVAEVEKFATDLKADFEAKLKEISEEAEPKETEAEAPKASEAAPSKKGSKPKS